MSDLIRRKPLVDMLQGVEDNIFAEATREVNPDKAFLAGVVEGVKNQVLALPAVDAVPVVHGRWKSIVIDPRHQITCDECSACGFKYGGLGIEAFLYCPNCGAKMSGGAE